MSEPGCPFEILPVELFFECVHYLDTVSVVHLSETCKTLSKILRHSRTERVSEHAFEYSEIILYPPLGSYVEVDDATIKEILSRPKKSSVRVDGFCPEGKCWEPVRCVPKTRIETVILKMMYSRLKSFLSAGLDPNSNLPGDEDDDGDKDDKRSSLLVTAIDYKDVEAVKILLQYGAKPTTLDDLLGYWPTNICPLMIGVLLDAGARPSSVHLATLLCELDGSPSPLIEFILNERLDVHCTYSGELEYTELTDATLLHIAAARGNPDLLEAIISRAPNQLHARVLGKSTSLGPRFLPGPRRFPDGESSEGWYDLYSPMNMAVGSYRTDNVKFLIECGCKVDLQSFELMWYYAGTSPSIWLDIFDSMAARINFDSPEAIPMIQRCTESFPFENVDPVDKFFQNLCLPSFLGNMSLRTRAQYLDKFSFAAYEADLDELRYDISWCEVGLHDEIQREGEIKVRAADRPTDCLSWLACLREHEKVQQEIVELLREAMLYSVSLQRLSEMDEGC